MLKSHLKLCATLLTMSAGITLGLHPLHAKPVQEVPTPAIRAQSFEISVGKTRLRGQMVRFALDKVRVKVALAGNEIGKTESLGGMAKRYGALAAINGSFFQAYNSGAYKPPVMTLITDGKPAFKGNIGTTLGFAADNEARMDSAPRVLLALRGASGDAAADAFWPRAQEAIGCGPRLVADGKVALDMVGEKFTDPKVLRLSMARSAVGITSKRELIFVVTSGTMAQLAVLMQKLGCAQAMNLDGGASSGLWLQGRALRAPGRDLSNALLVLPK